MISEDEMKTLQSELRKRERRWRLQLRTGAARQHYRRVAERERMMSDELREYRVDSVDAKVGDGILAQIKMRPGLANMIGQQAIDGHFWELRPVISGEEVAYFILCPVGYKDLVTSSCVTLQPVRVETVETIDLATGLPRQVQVETPAVIDSSGRNFSGRRIEAGEPVYLDRRCKNCDYRESSHIDDGDKKQCPILGATQCFFEPEAQ